MSAPTYFRQFRTKAAFSWYAIFFLLIYTPVILGMARHWAADSGMGHGFLVPVAAGYIAWQRREQWLGLPAAYNRWGLLLCAAGALELWAGTISSGLLLQRTSLLLSLTGLILFQGGTRALRILAFPLLLLLLMIPFPALAYRQITFPLQLIATRLAERTLEMMGFLVVREGNVLEMPSQALAVAEACSGIRAWLSLSFFAVTYAYWFDSRVWMRWFLLAAAVPVAILGNAARIVAAGVFSEYKPELVHGAWHTASGMVLLLMSIACLMAIRRLIAFVPTRREQ